MNAFLMLLGCLYSSVSTAQVFIDRQPSVLQIDKRAVSNRDWATFLQFARKDPTVSKQFSRSMIPSHWGSNRLTPTRQHEPITGVSWRQVSAYCEWRSTLATYSDTHATLGTYQQMQQANATAKTRITYRLPTDKEFKRLPALSTDNPTAGISFRCVRSVDKAS